VLANKKDISKRLKSADEWQDVAVLSKELLSGSRQALSRAITLVESELDAHRQLARDLIASISAHTGKSIRIAVSGPPGVGKSSFIEAIGKEALKRVNKLAVIAIDPSSELSKGSILGDKTRMQELSADQNVFIRPAAAGASLGGIASNTREVILLCEAAGFELIIIETVGVGQSETYARQLTDIFVVLLQPGSGDDLQAIKKGVLEVADILVITKADGDLIKEAKEAKQFILQAENLMKAKGRSVLLSSIHNKDYLREIWKSINELNNSFISSGIISKKRSEQHIFWFEKIFEKELIDQLKINSEIKEKMDLIKKNIGNNSEDPFIIARSLAKEIVKSIKS
jgi:LAO/AO transport system kinase